MALNTTQSAILRKTASAAFFDELPNAVPKVDMSRYITRFSTTTKNMDFGWWGSLPFPSQWTGSRERVAIKNYTDTLTPLKWSLALDFDVDAFDDDVTGTAAARGRGVAFQAREFFNKRATAVLEAGTAGTIDTAYDGQFFFDTDHDESGTNQSNDLTTAAATGTDPTASEFETAIGDAFEAMQAFTDDQGNPFPPGDIEVMVPPNFWKVASVVLGPNGTLSGAGGMVNASDRTGVVGTVPASSGISSTEYYYGTSGILRGAIPWQVNPYLTDLSGCYVVRRASVGSVGPLVMNLREDWKFKTFDPMNSAEHDDQQKISFVADSRFEIGYGLWQNAIFMDFT